ncbi:MAG: DUF2225 domain-containing protein [Lachnospiraceae bacterium]|nr:DUF2225 domain-containing protein [Lachnospiraceae bacterium]
MAGLLSGLDKLGLGGLEGMNLFDEADSKEAEIVKSKAPETVVMETDFLFDKTYECPVCYQSMKERTLKTGKAKLARTELNLRPVYEEIEPLKYDVIVCPHCGYASLSRFFGYMAPTQVKAVKENISATFRRNIVWKETYSYEDAIERYQLCLVNAIVKKAKASEKAYICLKAGWLAQAMQENMPVDDPDYASRQKEAKVLEREFMKNALEGFIGARQSESGPICGMDQNTVDYLIAVLAMEFGKYEVSGKLVSNIIVSPSSNERMKDRAREVKEILIEKMKQKK